MVTYEEQIMEDRLPASVVIAGAGAIGVEFAYIMHNYGVDVTMVEYPGPRSCLWKIPTSAQNWRRYYKKMGIKILTGARVDAIEESRRTP